MATELSPALCEAFVQRLMQALAVHRATANGANLEEGLMRLDAYRCAWRGEFSDEEKEMKATRALGLLAAWCMEPNVSSTATASPPLSDEGTKE